MILVTAAASVWLHKALISTAAAESEQQPAEEQTPIVEQPPAPTLLQTGQPQSTTPLETKPVNTIFTWTPTGVGDVQDVYSIRVATDPTTDTLTGELTTDLASKADNLPTASFDAHDLPEGAYYWQVRSCSATAPLVCHDWSAVWSIRVDATVPTLPTAEYTSAPYSQTVSFAGTAEALSTVAVVVDDKKCVATVREDGTWECTFEGDFEYGDYTSNIVSTDKAGNESPVVTLDFSVKELFIAPVITMQELPPVLDIVPVDETPENKVEQKPTVAVIDVVNIGAVEEPTLETSEALIKPLSTDGGIVQSSENGWQILGLPWFLWAGSAAGLAGASWAFGVPIPRRLSSILSL